MIILGFDPGQDKCGIAIMESNQTMLYHQVISADQVDLLLPNLCAKFQVDTVVMGNQTTSSQWQAQLTAILSNLQIVLVDERYSSLEARDRYWQIYPPQGLAKLIPIGLRTPPRPIDDIVAIILIERYLLSN